MIQRGRQLLDLLTDSRFREYQQRHGDPAALQRQIGSALERAAAAVSPDAPGLVAALALLRLLPLCGSRTRSALDLRPRRGGKDSGSRRAPRSFPGRAGVAHAGAPPDRLGWRDPKADGSATPQARPTPSPPVFRRSPISRLGFQTGAGPTKDTGPVGADGSCRIRVPRPALLYSRALAAGRRRPKHRRDSNRSIPACSRPGSARMPRLSLPNRMARCWPPSATRDPLSNTQYLQRYIEIHAANRYRHYRNRSLWGPAEICASTARCRMGASHGAPVVAAALTVTHVDFEEFVPLAVRGFEARSGRSGHRDRTRNLSGRSCWWKHRGWGRRRRPGRLPPARTIAWAASPAAGVRLGRGLCACSPPPRGLGGFAGARRGSFSKGSPVSVRSRLSPPPIPRSW